MVDFVSLTLFFFSILLHLRLCSGSLSCQPLRGTDGSRARNVRAVGEPASEFSCPNFEWNRDNLRRTVRYILKTEEKKFIRFRTPTRNYIHPQLADDAPRNDTMTWIWVADKFSYMLYYPHNIQTLSLATTEVITENTEEDEITVNCTLCGDGTSCGVGFHELKDVMDAEGEANDIEWEYLCIEADNGVLDIVSSYPPDQELSAINTRNFALPDILYHSRFLKLFFSYCPPWSLKCKRVPNYYCYRSYDSTCVVKELLSHYPKIIYLAMLLWLYFPLLVLYLPSSRQVYSVRHISKMFPTHKVPVYLGRFIQNCFLCYHTTLADAYGPVLIRLRRILGFILLSTLSFRFLVLSTYTPFSWIVSLLFLIAILIPNYLSVHITPEVPYAFPLFSMPYPPGMVRLRGSRLMSIEYQRLAFIMIERMFLPFDSKFWRYIFSNSFQHFTAVYYHRSPLSMALLRIPRLIISLLLGTITLLLSVVIVVVYFLLPLPYFVKELFLAVHAGFYQYCCHSVWAKQNRAVLVKLILTGIGFIHASLLCILLLYLAVTLYSLCFMLTEIVIFTYLGASIAANIVFHYFVLIVAFCSAVYALVHSIHKQYFNILRDTSNLLENSNFELNYVKMLIQRRHSMKVSLVETASGVKLIGNPPVQYREMLYINRDLVNYMSTSLFFSITESIHPIRRQIPLVFIKLFLMIFFIALSLWTKNVYKNESIVSDIFSVAEKMALPFIPAALQWLSSQGHFGRRSDAQQKIDIVHALVEYAQKQSDTL